MSYFPTSKIEEAMVGVRVRFQTVRKKREAGIPELRGFSDTAKKLK